MISLKSSISLLSVFDIILGVFYCLFLAADVIGEWRFFNLNGPHYLLTTYYVIRIASLTFGILGLMSSIKLDVSLAKCYYNTKIYELIVLPTLGLASSYDMCQSYVYNQPCNDIIVRVGVANTIRLALLLYSAYIAKSYYRRLERGEIILATYGRSIVELIDQVTSQKSKSDLELQAVRGVAV